MSITAGGGRYMSSAERAKLAGIETGATADQTAAEVRDLLQTLSGADRLDFDRVKEGSTNKILLVAERAKLASIETGATADQTAAEVRDLLQTLAGADRLDPLQHLYIGGTVLLAPIDSGPSLRRFGCGLLFISRLRRCFFLPCHNRPLIDEELPSKQNGVNYPIALSKPSLPNSQRHLSGK